MYPPQPRSCHSPNIYITPPHLCPPWPAIRGQWHDASGPANQKAYEKELASNDIAARRQRAVGRPPSAYSRRLHQAPPHDPPDTSAAEKASAEGRGANPEVPGSRSECWSSGFKVRGSRFEVEGPAFLRPA